MSTSAMHFQHDDTFVAYDFAAHLQNGWFEYYRKQGYSNRQSLLLTNQICGNRPRNGRGRARGEEYHLPSRRERRSQEMEETYHIIAPGLSLRDVEAAIAAQNA